MDFYRAVAALYDWEHDDYREDVDFYLNIVGEGPILEVGVGSGRIMRPLLEAGFEVWGVDSSEEMLGRAKERLRGFEKGHLLHLPVADLELTTRFATALMPLNFLWHLPEQEEQMEALRAVRKHLTTGSRLIVDLSNPLMLTERGSEGELRLRSSTVRGKRHLMSFSAAWEDEAAQHLTLCLIYDEVEGSGAVRRSVADLELRYLYGPELELLLRLCGFQAEHVYGSYELEPYSSSSPRLIAIASAV